ncbi:hypothetical protein [Serinicoccus sediminis]|uniref:hypothetical protein n=1 Tax=Serinicoccus sediminis TaxID=2306021 RepID=UPI0010227AAF|nr:hypothetical protein [Serinicoccus sediminis]
MTENDLRIKGLLGEPDVGPWGIATFTVELNRWPSAEETHGVRALAHRMTRADVEVPSGDRTETPHLVVHRAQSRKLAKVVEDLQDLLNRVNAGERGRGRRPRREQRPSVTSELHRLLGSNEPPPPPT